MPNFQVSHLLAIIRAFNGYDREALQQKALDLATRIESEVVAPLAAEIAGLRDQCRAQAVQIDSLKSELAELTAQEAGRA